MKTNKFHFSNQTENKPFLGRSQTCIQLHFLAFSVWFNTTVKLSFLNQPLCCAEENVTKFLSDGGSVVKINKRGSRLHNATINHSPTCHKTKRLSLTQSLHAKDIQIYCNVPELHYLLFNNNDIFQKKRLTIFVSNCIFWCPQLELNLSQNQTVFCPHSKIGHF